jgi:RNA polymerase sigma factor (sigma-70 family)
MPPSSAAKFNTTRWSVVIAVRNNVPATLRHTALDELARLYWPPLYAYLRRRGYAPHLAEDLTQEFFARLLESDSLKSVDAAKGKFRSFLLASLNHFLANHHDRQHALKRGGNVHFLSLSAADAESRCPFDPADTHTPEQLFNHRWAVTLLDAVIARLKSEYAAKDQLPLFEALQGTLTGELQEGYADIAARFHTTEGALQVTAHRLRKRYRQLLREEIAHTVSDAALIDEELRDLFNAL